MAHIFEIKAGVIPFGGATLKSKKGPTDEYIIGVVLDPNAKVGASYSYNRDELHYKGNDKPKPFTDDEFVELYTKYCGNVLLLEKSEILRLFKNDKEINGVLRDRLDREEAQC